MTHMSTFSTFNSNNKKESAQRHNFPRKLLKQLMRPWKKRRDCSLYLNFKRKFNKNYQIELFNHKREIHSAYILIHFNKSNTKIKLVFGGNLKYPVHISKHEMPVRNFELQNIKP